MAYIKGPRGLNGELAAFLYKPTSNTLKKELCITLEKDGKSEEFKIENIKRLKRTIGIKLKEINDREASEHWKGATLLVERDDLEPLEGSEFYHFELEGSEVFDDTGEKIGIVNSVDGESANSILNIDSDGKEVLIPFVKAIVREVDIKKKRIIIKKIDGLI